jgi:hypothetical protein
MTIIDVNPAKSLGPPLQECTLVPIAGMRSSYLSAAFVTFDVYFKAADNVGQEKPS